jgi:hypothetical protein
VLASDDITACRWHEPGGLAAAESIAAFLAQAGIPLAVTPLTGPSFVPGLAIEAGVIQIEPGGAAYPGDLLHEAGHIAVAEPARREVLSEVGTDGGEEMAAIAWSVAAARACDVPLEVLFHADGYKGGAAELVADWEAGQPFGVPLLTWYGMTTVQGFPAMSRWLR